MKKNAKRYCRIEKILDKKIKLLYKDNKNCKDCKFGCLGQFQGKECLNKEVEYTINQVIEMLNDDEVDLLAFAEKQGLKFDILLDAIRGNSVLNYKYYVKLIERLYPKETEEFEKYYAIFENNDNKLSLETAGGNING